MATTHGEENNSLEWTPPKGATYTHSKREKVSRGRRRATQDEEEGSVGYTRTHTQHPSALDHFIVGAKKG